MAADDKRKIVFRCDGNTGIGLGHVYRCIAMAEMLDKNFSCEFVLSSESNFKKVIPPTYKIIYLDSEINLQTEKDWFQKNYDIPNTLAVLDGYQFDSGYQKKLRALDLKFVYVDDLQKEFIYANAVINHAPGINPDAYQKNSDCRLYLGPEFVLLRKQFLQAARSTKNSYQPVSKVFISLGGSDPHNISLKIANALILTENIKEIDIVAGAAYKFKAGLNDLALNTNKKINIHSNLTESEMVGLLTKCHAVFVPCSTTCYEAFAVNKPVFAGFSASNQSNLYNWFQKHGLIFDLGNLQSIETLQIKNIVEEKIKNISDINEMLNAQKKLIDGNSGDRVMSLVTSLFNGN